MRCAVSFPLCWVGLLTLRVGSDHCVCLAHIHGCQFPCCWDFEEAGLAGNATMAKRNPTQPEQKACQNFGGPSGAVRAREANTEETQGIKPHKWWWASSRSLPSSRLSAPALQVNDFFLELKEGDHSVPLSGANEEMEDFLRSSSDSSVSSSSCSSNARGKGAREAGRRGHIHQGSEEGPKERSAQGRRRVRQRFPPLPQYLLSLPEEDQRWGDVRGTDGCARMYSVRFSLLWRGPPCIVEFARVVLFGALVRGGDVSLCASYWKVLDLACSEVSSGRVEVAGMPVGQRSAPLVSFSY